MLSSDANMKYTKLLGFFPDWLHEQLQTPKLCGTHPI